MGAGSSSGLWRGFGFDEDGQIAVPPRYSNVRLSRIAHAKERGGCTRCYPHGPETTNATHKKGRRSWKDHRRVQRRASL